MPVVLVNDILYNLHFNFLLVYQFCAQIPEVEMYRRALKILNQSFALPMTNLCGSKYIHKKYSWEWLVALIETKWNSFVIHVKGGHQWRESQIRLQENVSHLRAIPMHTNTRECVSPETSVNHLENARTDHDTVKPNHSDSSWRFCPSSLIWHKSYPSNWLTPVEAWLKVDSGSKSIHPDKHLGEEEAEENIPGHQLQYVWL